MKNSNIQLLAISVISIVTLSNAQNYSETTILRDIEKVLSQYQSRQFGQYPNNYYNQNQNGNPGQNYGLYNQNQNLIQTNQNGHNYGLSNQNQNGNPGQNYYNQNGNPNQNYGLYNQNQNLIQTNQLGNNGDYQSQKYGLYNQQLAGPNFPGQFGPFRPGNQQYGLYNQNNFYQRPGPSTFQDYLTQGVGGLQNALLSIAQYDSLRCVPRLLCEMTAGRNNFQREPGVTSWLSYLPAIDFSTLLSFIQAIDKVRQPTPLFYFGRAALLGYSANGNSYLCQRAFPECPRNPDELVAYLNNHNGGFFRFFQGAGAQRPNQFPYNPYNQHNIQKRIVHKPSKYITSDIVANNHINNNVDTFYYKQNNENDVNYFKNKGGRKVSFKFPDEYKFYVNFFPKDNEYVPYKKGKAIVFDNYENTNNVINTGFTTPDLSLVKMVFPDRTGTGELILDSEPFNNYNNRPNNYGNKQVYQHYRY